MGQIVKRKKGRPSKADLAARAAAELNNGLHNPRRRGTAEEEEERDIRRSLRRRGSVRYNVLDYDDEDYLDDDEEFEFDDDRMEEEEDGAGRREKKLKFVLKLPNSANRGRSVRSNGDSAVRARRGGFRGSESEGEEEEEEDEESRFVKKRRICGDEDGEDEADDDYGDNDDEEERGNKRESYKVDFAHGTLNNVPSRTPMPEKKHLELILDKLQKKDTYGVYAEPVDPEELPDYHDIIKQPMDFATVRKKLAAGSYSIFEQFESDVYLICSNAMQYNSPDTVYHKQAHAIKELAERKFQRIRRNIEHMRIENEQTEKEASCEQKRNLSPMIKKQIKKPIGRSMQDPVSSDFSSGPTPATTDAHNTSNGVQASNDERLNNNEGIVQGISTLVEDNVDKVEDLLSAGKGMLPKLWRKPVVVDENRRATYEISNQPVDRSESIFSTFESEDKQLIPVGLHGEHSYAQSLARYAATLGPVAWRTASKRIEQALPPESKFGRGWIVEYEPIPAPVLFIAGQSRNEYSCAQKPQCPPPISVKIDNPGETLASASEQRSVGGPSLNEKPCMLPCSGGSRPATPSGAITQQQNPFVRKLQNAAIPVKGINKTLETPSANGWGEKRHLSDSKPPQVSSLGGSRPTTPQVSSLGESRPTTPTGAASQQQHPFVRKLQNASVSAKKDESPESIVTTSGCLDSGYISEGKSSILPNSRGSRPSTPTGAVIQPRNPFLRNNLRPENTATNRLVGNTPIPISQNTNTHQQKHFPGCTEMATSWQADAIARKKNFLQSVPIRPPSPANEGAIFGRISNGNVNGSVDINRMANSPSSGAATQVIGTKTSFLPQGLSDPVQAMRFSAENAQKQQSKMNNIFGPSPIGPSVQSIRGDNNTSGVTTSANAWMHASASEMNRPVVGNLNSQSNQIPADSLYNRTREVYPHILQSGEYPVSGARQFQPERSKVPFQEGVPISNPAKVSNETQVQNRQMSFPPFLTADPSRISSQLPWQGLSRHSEQKKKRDTLPPDLNVAFQSTVDPQQPDLALQL